jgi:branched-chain amino acid transport system ATP-binding protein
VLEVRGLVAGYGSLDVLHDVSIAVGDGEWVAVIGANGAGKSTLLNAILGTVSRRGGSIVHDDVHLETMRPADVVRRGIVLVPEGRHVFSDMTVEDNLALGTYTRRGAGRAGIAADLARSYALFPVLHERRRQLAGTLSGGEQQMLAIARALMASPTTLLLDELYRGLAALHADGTSIVLVEQNVTLALEAVQRAYVMANGAIVSSGRAADLLADPVVREAYLGVRRDKY